MDDLQTSKYVKRPADIEAKISYLTTEEGGRRGPVKSGYRPNHDFGLSEGLCDAVHEYPNNEWVQPGESIQAFIWFFTPELQVGRLNKGFEFKVQEGAHVVATGKILKVINMELRNDA